jgi:hypothetical protein
MTESDYAIDVSHLPASRECRHRFGRVVLKHGKQVAVCNDCAEILCERFFVCGGKVVPIGEA